MPVILLQKPVGFPVVTLREMLRAFVPTVSWQIGEDDHGHPDDTATLDRPQTIIGRMSGEPPILIGVTLHDRAFAPADGSAPPPHRCHVSIHPPTIDRPDLALRIEALVAAAIVQEDGESFTGFDDDGSWLSAAEMADVVPLLQRDGELRGLLARARPRGAAVAPPPSPSPTTPAPSDDPPATPRDEMEQLGSITLLLDGELRIDWRRIDEIIAKVDPEGRWSSIATPGGTGFVQGRGAITLAWLPLPMDGAALDNAIGRSFWLKGDAARMRGHRQHLTIHTRTPAAWADKHLTALVASVVIGMLAREPQVVGVFNNYVNTVFEPKMVEGFLGIVANGEIPIPLWTWTAPNSMTDGNVCLTTGGFAPFLGYEVEIWNAPLDVATVHDKLNGILRYVLTKGPVIAHGDTVGQTADDQAIRCFFGESRADRPKPIKVMFVEFAAPAAAAPRPDPILPPRPAVRPGSPTIPRASAPPAPLRRPGGFGRKGL